MIHETCQTIFDCMSPLANSDFIGFVYIVTSIMLVTLTGMPVFIRLSLALPLFVTAMVFIFISGSLPVSREEVILVRLSHLVFMISLIINSILYAIAKKRRAGNKWK